MANYEAKIIQEFADRLYAKAKTIIFSFTFYGLILGGVSGYVAHQATHNSIFTMLGLIIGAAIGYSIGKEKAFKYKLEAQTALCQVKIEENTRKSI